MEYKVCEYCKEKFYKKPYHLRCPSFWVDIKYCSRECWKRSIKGVKKTLEHRKNISLGRKRLFKKQGFLNSLEQRRKSSLAHLGQIPSEETRKKQSEAKKGNKAYNFKGYPGTERHTLMNRREYVLWRIAVFTRDDYTCQNCNVRGGELNADHIKPWALYPELRYAIDNGRTLCVNCHRQTDTWGARIFSRKVLG